MVPWGHVDWGVKVFCKELIILLGYMSLCVCVDARVWCMCEALGVCVMFSVCVHAVCACRVSMCVCFLLCTLPYVHSPVGMHMNKLSCLQGLFKPSKI